MVASLQQDCVVIGAGVVGLAVARALALQGRDVLVLEAEPQIGQHSSSRNSEVIHAGIYYPPGSLKATLCVEGRHQLYDYCARRGIEHRRLGKLIVATADDELPRLQDYQRRAVANGVHDLRWLSSADVQQMEPVVRAVAALHSPSTGIIDSHALMRALKSDAEAAGASVLCGAPVLGGAVMNQGASLQIGGAGAAWLSARLVINCAGLSAPLLARRLEGFPADKVPPAHFAKGHYFALRGRSPFSRLVYPVAVPGGLGTHVTLDLAGQARFGPDVCWVDTWDYVFDETRVAGFYTSIRRYYPGLPEGSLVPSHVGVRAKIVPPGAGEQDFLVQGPQAHGQAGLVNLFGIESPGLTACLALADRVARLVSAEA